MPLAFDSSASFSGEDQTTPTSVEAWTIAATADRFAIAGMFTKHNPPATHTEMRISGSGGSVMAQLGTTSAVSAVHRFSRWNLFGGGLPASGASRVLYGLLSAIQDTCSIVAAAYNGVDQTTPIGASDVATGSATSTSFSPSITLATVAGDKVVAMLVAHCASIVTTSSITGVTTREQQDVVLEHQYLIEVDAVGTSTTITPAVTLSASSDINWEMRAYVIKAAGGGAPSDQGKAARLLM